MVEEEIEPLTVAEAQRVLKVAACPGFTIVNREPEDSDFDGVYYRCGEHIFRDTVDVEYSYIARLTSSLTRLPGTIVLAFGHHGSGNVAAIEYIFRHPGKLAPRRDGSFFQVIAVDRRIGVNGASIDPLDISDSAFNSG